MNLKTRVKTSADNLTGRDNRTPFIGKTQFPTEGSKAKAKSLDSASKDVAEVGPAPLTSQLDKTHQMPLKEVMITMPTAKGSLPIVKQACTKIQADPLVQYLKKHAQQLESNVDNMIASLPPEIPMLRKDSDFVGTPAESKMQEQDALLKKLFSNYDSSAPKL